MTRWILFIFSAILLGCDTSSSVEPRFNNFFVKIIGTDGNQYGNDVIQASDGGFVIVGKTESSFGALSEFLVVKTDSIGNTEWIFPDEQNTPVLGEAVSVVESGGSFIVGGTVGFGDLRRTQIIKVDASGALVGDPFILKTNETDGTQHFNALGKLTIGNSVIIISGQTGHPLTTITGGPQSGFIGQFDAATMDLIPFIGIDSIQYFGSDGTDNVIGAYQTNYGSDKEYVALGSSNDPLKNGTFNLTHWFLNSTAEGASSGSLINSDNQNGNGVATFNDKYYIIGAADGNSDPVWLEEIDESDINTPGVLRTYSYNQDAIGKSVAVQPTGEFAMSIDLGFVDMNDDINRSSTIGLSQAFGGSLNWTRIFGVEGRNFANSVIIDRAGSIVTVGTVDLESQFKVVLIKTGPNGEMSF